MAIQPLTGKINNPVSPSNLKQSNKSDTTDIDTIQKPADSVAITTTAKKITEAFESSETTPPINEKKVFAVKQAIENGTYSVNAEKIAEKMINSESL